MDCYCVCHSPFSSRGACEHCQGVNEVGEYQHIRSKVIAALGYLELDGILYDQLGMKIDSSFVDMQIQNLTNLIIYEKRYK